MKDLQDYLWTTVFFIGSKELVSGLNNFYRAHFLGEHFYFFVQSSAYKPGAQKQSMCQMKKQLETLPFAFYYLNTLKYNIKQK